MFNRPLLFNPAASYDFGYDYARQMHSDGCSYGDNADEFLLDPMTADRGESDFLKTIEGEP